MFTADIALGCTASIVITYRVLAADGSENGVKTQAIEGRAKRESLVGTSDSMEGYGFAFQLAQSETQNSKRPLDRGPVWLSERRLFACPRASNINSCSLGCSDPDFPRGLWVLALFPGLIVAQGLNPQQWWLLALASDTFLRPLANRTLPHRR